MCKLVVECLIPPGHVVCGVAVAREEGDFPKINQPVCDVLFSTAADIPARETFDTGFGGQVFQELRLWNAHAADLFEVFLHPERDGVPARVNQVGPEMHMSFGPCTRLS